MPQLSERDYSEIERSAVEAAQIKIQPPNRDNLRRYQSPPSDTIFPLEYAFWLLGDVRGKRVVDLGCGSGENLIPLIERGADVIGIDISPDLISLARQRLRLAGLDGTVEARSAYDTGLPEGSIDVIFCCALIHHLEIERISKEMSRILSNDGKIILTEPIRFSKAYSWLRSLLPSRENVSEYEHPLTRAEFREITAAFKAEATRYFRLPFVAALLPIVDAQHLFKLDRWCINTFPATLPYATRVVTKLSRRCISM